MSLGLTFGMWSARIPDVEAMNHFSDSELGILLVVPCIGCVTALPLAAKFCEVWGSAKGLLLGAVIVACFSPLVGLRIERLHFALLFIGSYFLGFVLGWVDVCMNVQSSLIEKQCGFQVNGFFQFFYSSGNMIGAIIGGILSQHGVSVFYNFLFVETFIHTCLATWAYCYLFTKNEEQLLYGYYRVDNSSQLPECQSSTAVEDSVTFSPFGLSETRQRSTSFEIVVENSRRAGDAIRQSIEGISRQRSRSLEIDVESSSSTGDAIRQSIGGILRQRSRSLEIDVENITKNDAITSQRMLSDYVNNDASSLIVLSCIGFFTYFGEGAIGDWSSVYLKGENFLASSTVSSLGFAAFSVIVAIGRYSSDYLVLWYDRRTLLAFCGLVAFIGLMVVFAAADFGDAYIAICGFGIAGIGISLPVPLVLSLAANSPNMKPERAIALVSGYSYFGSMLGPVAFGLTLSLVGNLKWSFFISAFVLILIAPFAFLLEANKPSKSLVFADDDYDPSADFELYSI